MIDHSATNAAQLVRALVAEHGSVERVAEVVAASPRAVERWRAGTPRLAQLERLLAAAEGETFTPERAARVEAYAELVARRGYVWSRSGARPLSSLIG